MIKIAFHTPQIDIRGTCDAIYNYAHYNETILHNKSVIIVPKNSANQLLAVSKFLRRFKILFYSDILHMEHLISDCDILYCIKYGTNDNIMSKNIKTVIHCVFDLSEPHGDVYAAVSDSLARKFQRTLFVPHMIGLSPSFTEENLRIHLGISENATVFGRHGGEDTFDLDFAKRAIIKVLQKYKNICFVFVNTPKFFKHPQLFFLDKIIDSDEKNKFISTCDAHIECGSLGHSFGISIGEFSVNNKPIIAYNGSVWNDAHINILGNKGIYYHDENSFYDILTTFNKEEWKLKDNNCYQNYSPKKVMEKFQRIFIE